MLGDRVRVRDVRSNLFEPVRVRVHGWDMQRRARRRRTVYLQDWLLRRPVQRVRLGGRLAGKRHELHVPVRPLRRDVRRVPELRQRDMPRRAFWEWHLCLLARLGADEYWNMRDVCPWLLRPELSKVLELHGPRCVQRRTGRHGVLRVHDGLHGQRRLRRVHQRLLLVQ